ncbi:hypothetical protein CPB83DRAFT_776352 [Crepidotus variabilis]|uniref:Uncharacterized protein n=1 Tax=Crepidotus variabilis TaxID=179855 RepID=A0A9P6E5N6_9AGAR|nr:hypothetical protein CPB83DRAFT_776352 [Crepidotus variabilis]
MKRTRGDREIHEASSRFDIKVREEASVLLWYIWREKREEYANLQSCTTALQNDDELYCALKAAHLKGEYNEIREWRKSHVSSSFERDAEIENDVQLFLNKLKPSLRKLVLGEIILPVWVPAIDELDAGTLDRLANLRIPCIKGKPNLLLHDLGTFSQDSVLDRRLKNIFMPNNHTFLVNTSGSGKTRLLFEGLCSNWGFYLTSLVDSSGLSSSDVHNSIQTHVPEAKEFRRVLPPAGSSAYENALQTNKNIASRVFRQILLARLMIFDLFLDNVVQKEEHDAQMYRKQWLLLQLQPSFVHPEVWDVFEGLSCKLAKASDAFINFTTTTLLRKVRSLCALFEPPPPSLSSTPSTSTPPSPHPLPTSSTSQLPFFCVLDEAQHAATQLTTSFRSSHSDSHRPILREIISAWEQQTAGHGVFMVVAGTGISKDVVDQAIASAIMKESRYRWCSDTGAFEGEEGKEEQKLYLERYVGRDWLEREAGRRLMERMWYWLHGRYRFTSGYVAELVFNGLRRPHGLLNAYIQHFTHFNVTDAASFVLEEDTTPLPVLSLYKPDFEKLKKNSDMLSTIHHLTSHYLMRSTLPTLGSDEATYVEYGYARFIDSATKSVVVDEPLILSAAMNWIGDTSYWTLARAVQKHEKESNGFENYIAFCLDKIFSASEAGKRRIEDVFTFATGRKPGWADQEGELVSIHRTGSGTLEDSPVRHSAFQGPSATLGTNGTSAEETSCWLQHSSPTPLLFPHNAMGPDLVFVLRLSGGSLIWVVLQAKYCARKEGKLARESLRQAVKSVTPSCFWLDKNGDPFSPSTNPEIIEKTTQSLLALPKRQQADAGRYSLLRVIVSFPADSDLKRCLHEDPDKDGHPIASLNMKLVKQITSKLSPKDFLQGLEDGISRGALGRGKRNRTDGSKSTSRPKKKIKLS